MGPRRVLRAVIVASGWAALLTMSGCTAPRLTGSECGGGAGCAPVVPVATSDRAHVPSTARVGRAVLGTFATSSSRGNVCFRLLRPGVAPVALAFPPETVATPSGPTKTSKGGHTLIGAVVGGVGTGERVSVAPDATTRSATVDGCGRGPVWYSGRVALASRAPGAERAPCDQAASAPLDCRPYTSVRGFDPTRRVPWFAQNPVGVRVLVIDGFRTAEVAAPGGTIRVPLVLIAGGATSVGSPATLRSSCTPRTSAPCGEDAWLRAFFRGHVAWVSTPQHPEVVTLHRDDRRAMDLRVRP